MADHNSNLKLSENVTDQGTQDPTLGEKEAFLTPVGSNIGDFQTNENQMKELSNHHGKLQSSPLDVNLLEKSGSDIPNSVEAESLPTQIPISDDSIDNSGRNVPDLESFSEIQTDRDHERDDGFPRVLDFEINNDTHGTTPSENIPYSIPDYIYNDGSTKWDKSQDHGFPQKRKREDDEETREASTPKKVTERSCNGTSQR